MRGFRVQAADGTELLVEATHYTVDDDGDLVLRVGEQVVRRVGAGAWIAVDAAGTPLTTTWPPDDLDLLLDRLHRETAVTWGYTESVGSPDDYNSPLLNDLDAFMAQLTQQLGLDPDSTDKGHRQIYSTLRDLIRRHFKDVPQLPLGLAQRSNTR